MTYFPNGSSCELCSLKTNTLTCDATTGHALTCTTGSYVDDNNVCVACGSNCNTCTSLLSCINCSSTYFPNSGICELCTTKNNV